MLEIRHPGAVRPLYASAWTAAAWLAAAAADPEAGAVVTGISTPCWPGGWPGSPARPGPSRPGRPRGGWPSPRPGAGTLAAARPLGSAISRTWSPLALPAAIAVRRLRLPLAALVLAPPLLEWLDRRPPLDPARYAYARLLDDAGYSVGVWQGRNAAPFGPTTRAARTLPSFMRCDLGMPRLNSAGTITSSGDSSPMEDRPSASSVESMPPRSTSKTFLTPVSVRVQPPQVGAADHDGSRAQRERLDHVAAAPDPAVEQHLICPPTASATPGSARIEAGVPSRSTPPWFDTEIAAAPMSTAARVVGSDDALDHERAARLLA